MGFHLLPLRTLIDPLTVPRAVESRTWLLPVLLLMVTTSASGVAVALRLDASRSVIPKMESSGELARASEREIDEEVQKAERVAVVAAVAKGVLGMPVVVALIAFALKLCGWLVGKKALFPVAFTAAALALLPAVVFHLVLVGAALRQPALTVSMVEGLVPTSLASLVPDAAPKWERVLRSVDLFNLWSAALLGLGLSAAVKVSRWKGLGIGFVLYTLFALFFLIGLPGLASGGGGAFGGPR